MKVNTENYLKNRTEKTVRGYGEWTFSFTLADGSTKTGSYLGAYKIAESTAQRYAVTIKATKMELVGYGR